MCIRDSSYTSNSNRDMNDLLLTAFLSFGELEGSRCMIGLNLLSFVLSVIGLFLLNVRGVTNNAL